MHRRDFSCLRIVRMRAMRTGFRMHPHAARKGACIHASKHPLYIVEQGAEQAYLNSIIIMLVRFSVEFAMERARCAGEYMPALPQQGLWELQSYSGGHEEPFASGTKLVEYRCQLWLEIRGPLFPTAGSHVARTLQRMCTHTPGPAHVHAVARRPLPYQKVV